MTELKSPEIEKTLVLSTGHIRKTDDDELRGAVAGDDSSGLIVHHSKYWYVIYCGDMINLDNIRCVSAELINCLRIGAEMGCTFVKFNRDGPEHDELPTFDW